MMNYLEKKEKICLEFEKEVATILDLTTDGEVTIGDFNIKKITERFIKNSGIAELLEERLIKQAVERSINKGLQTDKLLPNVGDKLYIINMNMPANIRGIETYYIDNIVIYEDDVMYKYDSYDGVICTLNNILNDTEYWEKRIFTSYEKAEEELKKSKDRVTRKG